MRVHGNRIRSDTFLPEHERLAVQPEEIRVRKTTPDSFHKTELQSLLQARKRREACRLRLTE